MRHKKNSRKNKKRSMGNIIGLIFTGAMVVCCCVVYILSQNEDNTIEEVAAPTAVATPAAAERAYPSVEVFLSRAAEYGLRDEVIPAEGSGPEKRYAILRGEELRDAELILSIKNGGVRSFTLISGWVYDPGGPPEQPTPVELSLYEQRLARYYLETAWRETVIPALSGGMDIMGELTYGDKAAMIAAAAGAEPGGKMQEFTAGGFELGAFVLEREGEQLLSTTVTILE